jgi:predicted site-specific integrase-resolvase
MEPLLNVNDVARVLCISPWTVRAYVRTGKLQPVRIGKRILFTEAEICRLIRNSFVGPQPTYDSIDKNI